MQRGEIDYEPMARYFPLSDQANHNKKCSQGDLAHGCLGTLARCSLSVDTSIGR
jgi:hypothetical protein